MGQQAFLNNGKTVLFESCAATDTTLSVPYGFAALVNAACAGGNYVKLTLTQSTTETAWEIVTCTGGTTGNSGSGDTINVVRGQEGTSAVAWAASSKCESRITAAFLMSLASGGGSSVCYTPDGFGVVVGFNNTYSMYGGSGRGFVLGYNNTMTTDQTFAVGIQNGIFGYQSGCLGNLNNVIGNRSFAIGSYNTVYGTNSVAMCGAVSGGVYSLAGPGSYVGQSFVDTVSGVTYNSSTNLLTLTVASTVASRYSPGDQVTLISANGQQGEAGVVTGTGSTSLIVEVTTPIPGTITNPGNLSVAGIVNASIGYWGFSGANSSVVQRGQFSWSATGYKTYLPTSANNGSGQWSFATLSNPTTGTTAIELTLDQAAAYNGGGWPGSSNRWVFESPGKAYRFTVDIVGKISGGANAWTNSFVFLAVNQGGTVTLSSVQSGTAITVGTFPTPAIAFSVNTTGVLPALVCTVTPGTGTTGASGFVGKISAVEVIQV